MRGEGDSGKQKGILGSPPSGNIGGQRTPGQSSSSTKITQDSTLKPPKLTFRKFEGENPKG